MTHTSEVRYAITGAVISAEQSRLKGWDVEALEILSFETHHNFVKRLHEEDKYYLGAH